MQKGCLACAFSQIFGLSRRRWVLEQGVELIYGRCRASFVNAGFEIPVNDYWDVTARGIYNIYSSQAFPTTGGNWA